MPLFSGVPIFNVRPGDTASDGRSQAAFSRGLSRGFQGRQFNESLSEQKRQFDALGNFRAAQSNINQARAADIEQKSREGVIISEWMKAGARDSSAFETAPDGVTSFEGLTRITEIQAKASSSMLGFKNKEVQSTITKRLEALPPKEFTQAMNEMNENGLSEKFWGIIETAPVEATNITTGAITDLLSRAGRLEEVTGRKIIPRNPDGTPSGALPSLDNMHEAAMKAVAIKAGSAKDKARLAARQKANEIQLKAELDSIEARASFDSTSPDFFDEKGVEIDPRKVEAARGQAITNFFNRLEQVLGGQPEAAPSAPTASPATLQEFFGTQLAPTGRVDRIQAPVPALDTSNPAPDFDILFDPATGQFKRVR